MAALLEAVDGDGQPARRTGWPQRDLALILTGLLAGLRADELHGADVDDIGTTVGGGAVIHVRGKGSKDRAVAIVADLVACQRDLPRQPGAPLPHPG